MSEYKEKRGLLGLTQLEVSKAVGIDRTIISKIENDSLKPTADQTNLLDDFYSKFSYENQLTAKIDYFKMTFKTTNIEHFCQNILGMNFGFFHHEDRGTKFYPTCYTYANVIKFFVSEDKDNKGILFELKGQGCRQFEVILEERNETWQDFFLKCFKHKGKCTRLDIAIDDKQEIFPMLEMKECLEKDLYETKFVNGYSVQGGASKKGSSGLTIYFGSLQSDMYFCFYQKNYEIAKREKIDISEIEEKNRYELRFKQDKANIMFKRYCKTFDLLSSCLSIMRDRVSIYEYGVTKSDILSHHKWEKLLCSYVDVDLSVSPNSVDFQSMRRWVGTQCVQTLKVLQMKDYLDGTTFLQDMIDNAVLSNKYVNMLDQVMADMSDIIFHEEEYYFTIEQAVKLYLLQLNKELKTKARFYNLTDHEEREFLAYEELFVIEELEKHSNYLDREAFYQFMRFNLSQWHKRLANVQLLIKNSYQENIPFD